MRVSTCAWLLGLSLLGGLSFGLVACQPEDAAFDCKVYADDQPLADWTVEFVNMRAEPVYVEIDCRGQPFSLTDADGQFVEFDGFGCECFCSDLMVEGLASCFDCSSECIESSSAQRIEPGASWTVTMPGTVFERPDAIIDASCVDQELEMNQNCLRRRAAEPGEYTVSTVSSSTLVCGSGTCDCSDLEVGNCKASGSLGDPVELEAVLTFPGTASIVFE